MLGRYEGKIVERFERWRLAPLTWTPNEDHPRPSGSWDLAVRSDLGLDDVDGRRFEAISERMLNGNYYPSDAIDFFGPWQGRLLRAGDRILQCARVLGGLKIWSMAEIYIAEKTENSVVIGYLTSKAHFAKGMWTARLTRENKRLYLDVKSVAAPNSLLLIIGKSYGRKMQMRATMRAIEEMTQIG